MIPVIAVVLLSLDLPIKLEATIAFLLIGFLGYIFNYKNRIAGSPSHSFFYIPMEFWAVIVPVFIFNVSQIEEQEMAYIESAMINDKYVVDFTKIFEGIEGKYKYGVMKVLSVTSDEIRVTVSKIAYNKPSGPVKDIREGKANEASYYSSDSSVFTKSELLDFKKSGVIYSVVR